MGGVDDDYDDVDDGDDDELEAGVLRSTLPDLACNGPVMGFKEEEKAEE